MKRKKTTEQILTRIASSWETVSSLQVERASLPEDLHKLRERIARLVSREAKLPKLIHDAKLQHDYWKRQLEAEELEDGIIESRRKLQVMERELKKLAKLDTLSKGA